MMKVKSRIDLSQGLNDGVRVESGSGNFRDRVYILQV